MRKFFPLLFLVTAIGCTIGQLQLTPIFDGINNKVEYDNGTYETCKAEEKNHSHLPKKSKNIREYLKTHIPKKLFTK